ncbi:MAG: ABC transporter ATP-binding protein [Deltaproteobacteria bacterium]|nr:ABC transporter ATP-binding protein [Deltaproteobacteria bacterium]
MIPIHLDRVTKRFKNKLALDDVSFDVPVGSITALVGQNGAGKTTAIRMMLGLERPSSGRVQILGLDPERDQFEVKQRMGYVPEKPDVYQGLSVRRVLAFVRALYDRWSDEEAQRLAETLRLPLDSKVRTLSRGELAKLSMTLALAHRPELLVLDEPTSGLDPLVRQDVLSAVVDAVRDGSRTVLFSSHILTDVERIADRVVVLSQGRVVVADSLANLQGRALRVSFVFDATPPSDLKVPRASRVSRGLREVVAILPADAEGELGEIARAIGARDLMRQPMSFDDLFVELLGRGGPPS